ncbi:hypothetical protein EDB19DRAFT_1692465 [Suillus lakei]|nr:hypothetical protein EDB19DRAFT_1692465 [Suillus lakei]
MYDGDSTRNDQLPTPAYLHHEGFSHSNSLSPSDMTHSFLEIDQCDIHSASGQPPHNSSFNHFHFVSSDDSSANNPGFYGNVIESSPIEVHHHPAHVNQSESHAPNRSVICKWNGGHGPCDKTILEAEIGSHVSSCHLPPPKSPPAKCRWGGCNNPKPMRRDTILRHIRQIHLGINPRRMS